MLTLLKLPSAWGMRNASPFNLKAEALLAMSGLPFETREAMPSKGPMGKLPALIDGSRVIGDSARIQRHLEEAYGARFDEGLSARDRADAEAYRRLAEEWLYFIVLHLRWIERPGITREAFFGPIPRPLRGLIFGKLQREVRRTLWGQGIARHAQDDIHSFGIEAIAALDARIGAGPFFFGDRLRSVDAALYPQVLALADAPHGGPLRQAVQERPGLIAYCRRCDAAIFGEGPTQ